MMCSALQATLLLFKLNKYFSASPPGNQVVTVWPRHLSFSAATHWRTTMTSLSHQMWCFSANQKAAWVYASAGLAFVTTPHLFSRWPTRTQESPAMESASTSTAPFSEDITVLEGTRAATQRQQHRRRTLVKGLMAAVEAHPQCYLHLKKSSQHLHWPLGKRAANQVPTKMPESPHSTDEALLRWQPGTATARWPPCAYSATIPSSPPLGNAYIFSRGWWIAAARG